MRHRKEGLLSQLSLWDSITREAASPRSQVLPRITLFSLYGICGVWGLDPRVLHHTRWDPEWARIWR